MKVLAVNRTPHPLAGKAIKAIPVKTRHPSSILDNVENHPNIAPRVFKTSDRGNPRELLSGRWILNPGNIWVIWIGW
jgi:hypothetical protein